jgi:hypothetical protein
MSKNIENDSITTDKLLDEADEMKKSIKNQEDNNDISQLDQSPQPSPNENNVVSELKV